MRQPLLRTACAWLVVAALGCATEATRFYLLSPVPGGAVGTASSGIVVMGPVSMADYLDRPQLVSRQGPNTVDVAAYDQWAGPLDDMLPRVLSENLAARLPRDRVIEFSQLRGQGFQQRVTVDVSRFDVDEGGQATLVASWRVFAPGDTSALLARDAMLHATAAGAGQDARVAALSETLGLLADDIAQGLASLR